MNKYLISTLILLSVPTFGVNNPKFNVIIDPSTINISNEGTTPDNPNAIKCGVGEGETRESLITKINNKEDITKVCTSNITDFSSLFAGNSTFNQDISNWDVSNGINFSYMFHFAKEFNQPLNNWNVSNGTQFVTMFYGTEKFNQPLNNWNVSNGINFNYMFSHATSFNRNISNWNVSNAKSWYNFSHGAPLYPENTPNFE